MKITIETCAKVKMNRPYLNFMNIHEKLVEVLTFDSGVNDFYAAMMIKAAELGTFYANDLFDAFAEVWRASRSRWDNRSYSDEDVRDYFYAGSYMNAWSINGLISPTGNERMVDLHMYDDVYRKVPAKEWKVNFTSENIQIVLSALYGAYGFIES